MTVVVVAGSRSITDYDVVADAIEASPFELTELVSGGADGVDSLAETWAKQNDVSVTQFLYTDWTDEHHPKRAPLERNKHMASYAEAAVIVWDGESSGTEHMLEQARDAGLPVHMARTDSQTLDTWSEE